METNENKYYRIRSQFVEIEKAVQSYIESNDGNFLGSLDELKLDKMLLKDPWGKPIAYEHNESGYILTSSGPDKLMETNDDYKFIFSNEK